jgi:hypothetical protein
MSSVLWNCILLHEVCPLELLHEVCPLELYSTA